jgi:hypothetical protein
MQAGGLHYKNTCQSSDDLTCYSPHVAARSSTHRSIRLFGTLRFICLSLSHELHCRI